MRRPALPLALAALFALASFSLAPARPANAAAGDQRIGYELPDIGPGSGAGIVFVDALQQSSPWSSTSADALALDQLGNVASLRVGQAAERTIYTTESYPAGDYTLLYQGTGKFEAAGGVLEPGSAGRLTLHVVPNAGAGLRLRLIATDAKNPVRDVRLILPGYEAVYATHPFAPAFVRSLQGWNVLRFAQWSHADSFVGNAVWPARPHVDRPTQISPDGVALEYMVELANQTGADPWFALPAGATDGYVYGIADLVHRTLDPRLHAIFQYGNEMWKPGTPGNAYAQMAAHNYRLPGDAQTAAVGWYALRSPKVFEVVRDAFGADAARVVRVVTGPLADANGRNTALSILQRDAAHVDAFAVPATGALGAPGLAATVRLAAAHHLPLFGYAGGETVNPAAGAARTVARQSLSAWHAAGGTLWVGTPSEFALAGIRIPRRTSRANPPLRSRSAPIARRSNIPGAFPNRSSGLRKYPRSEPRIRSHSAASPASSEPSARRSRASISRTRARWIGSTSATRRPPTTNRTVKPRSKSRRPERSRPRPASKPSVGRTAPRAPAARRAASRCATVRSR
jgi:hypothetical protein